MKKGDQIRGSDGKVIAKVKIDPVIGDLMLIDDFEWFIEPPKPGEPFFPPGYSVYKTAPRIVYGA